MILYHLLVVFVEVSRHFCHGYQGKDVLPFLVKIEAGEKYLNCAGTILGPRFVLTSAYCVNGFQPENITVTHVATTVNKYRAEKIIVHPDYSKNTLRNDVALILIEDTFAEPWVAVTLKEFFPKTKCSHFQIAGWSVGIAKKYNETEPMAGSNSTKTEKPMIATVKIIPKWECVDLIGNFGGTFQGPEKLCGVTNDDGECFTGPGGPLLCSLAFISDPKEPEVTKNPESLKLVDVSKNETLADPIDLLANFKQTYRSHHVKRETETEGDSNPERQIVQVGVVSWGKSCSKIPSVYVRTDLYEDWLKDRMLFAAYKNLSNIRKHSLTPTENGSSTSQSFSPFKIAFGQLIIQFSFYFLSNSNASS